MNSTPDKMSSATRDNRLLLRLLLTMLIVSSAVPLALNLTDPDLWGHVQYGQDWLAEGELPLTATHTYTAVDHPWVNHENIAELLLATGFPALGTSGVLVAKCLLGLSILMLMWRSALRYGAKPISCWALLFLVAINLQAFFPLRPQLLSFLLCAVMLYVVERAFTFWDKYQRIEWRWLLFTPLIFAVWVNSHGGFVAGFGILTFYLGGKGLQTLARYGKGGWSRCLALLSIVVACAAATLVNPYGVGLHEWLIGSLGVDRPEITEWAPPRPGNPVFWPFITLIGVAIASLVFTQQKRDRVRIVILALVGWQAVEHLRHIAFFALLCGFWLPLHVQSVTDRLLRYASSGLPTASLSRWQRAIGVILLSAVIAMQSVTLAGRLTTLPVYRSNYPVDAIQWMADQEVHGKLVVSFNWAQYAIAALAPEIKVAFDGRFRTCYPQKIVDMSFDFLMGDLGPRQRSAASGPIDGEKVLEYGEPDYVLLDRRYRHASCVMQRAANASDAPWVLVYQDAISQVWGRRNIVDQPASERFIPQQQRFVSNHYSMTWVKWPALPKPTDNHNRALIDTHDKVTILRERSSR